MTPVRRRYVDLAHGQLHLAEAGDGPAVVLLHQTPRSVDEFRDVLPLLADAGLRAVAIDSPGYGASDPLPAMSIELLAAAVRQGLEAAGVRRAVVVGHHTGGVVAVELAAAAPQVVAGLVLSSTPLVDEEFRTRPGHGVDDVAVTGDGAHLLGLWQGRAGFYPPDRPDLLNRFVRDALTAGLERSSAGHGMIRSYRMEDRFPAVTTPVLLIGATRDPFGWPNSTRMRDVLPHARWAEIAEGMVPLPDQCPAEYAALVASFAHDVHGMRQP